MSGKNGTLVSIVNDTNRKSPVKLRYLGHPDLFSVARDSILRSLGKLLGPKFGAIFVDEFVSDFIEASFQMPKANRDNASFDAFGGWLHEWIGSLVVAREILLGSFSITDSDTTTDNTTERQTTKIENRRNRILLSLASSILPLLVDSSLWKLPTQKTNNIERVLSQQMLERNQTVVVLLIELIGAFCQVLRRNVNEILVSILYPIVEKITRRGSMANNDIIQQTCMSTLKIMSSSCGFRTAEDLIYGEQNRLIAMMVRRLRLPGGSTVPKRRGDVEEILSVAKGSTWVIEMINRRIKNEAGISQPTSREASIENDSSKHDKNYAIMDIVNLLDFRLDHLFIQKAMADADVEAVCTLHKAFFNYFLLLFDVKKDISYSYQMRNVEKDDSKKPWLDLLSQFRKVPLDTSATDDDDDDDDDDVKDNEGRLLDVEKDDIALFAKLIARDCYLLSYRKLESRISSCDAMTMAFKFLAFVGSEHNVSPLCHYDVPLGVAISVENFSQITIFSI